MVSGHGRSGERLHNLSTFGANRKKRAYARASSLDEFEVLTGKEYSKMVPLAQKHQGITKEEAENRTLAVFKQIEIRNLSLAIKLHGMSDDQTWNMAFDQCVKAQE